MGSSLQEQFLKMGLVNKNTFNKAKKDKHDAAKSDSPKKNEISEMARQALAEKKKQAQQHNKKKAAQQQAKENTAKALQLIETHRIRYEEGDVAYNFKDNTTIKKILRPQKAIDSLAKGKTGIVKLAGEYQFVPADVIYKIRDLNSKLVIVFNTPSQKKDDGDDPYAEFAIPDDLMW